jgi:hypothetical protein
MSKDKRCMTCRYYYCNFACGPTCKNWQTTGTNSYCVCWICSDYNMYEEDEGIPLVYEEVQTDD